MRKIILSVCIAAIVLSCIGVVAFGDSVDINAIKLRTADTPTVNAENRLELSLEFYILKDAMDYITANGEDLRVFGTINDYTEGMAAPEIGEGTEIDLVKIEDRKIDGKNYAAYSLNFGVFKPDEYTEKMAVRAFITFRINGAPYTVASDFSESKNTFSPYSAVYKVYTDRSPVATDEYAYKMPDGSYSKVKDLDPLRKILASYLFIEIKNGNARDKNAGKYYDSLYNISYFDGVLTIELDSSSAIPEWMLYKLVVDDVERYFEIYNGKIKLVV